MKEDCILFVDDEQNILNALERIFISDPVKVYTSKGAAEAMQAVREHNFSVIVSDNRMPGMSGVDFLEWSRAVSPDSIRILLTGYADLDSAINAINRGEVFRFVTKPWDDRELRQMVLDSIDRHNITLSIRSADEAKLLSLAQTIELKDPYTKGHCERVADYASRITDVLDMTEEARTNIKYGSWLHDCGKIGIPEVILNKPAALDDSQMEIVKRHSRWGADVARTARLPEAVINIALYHHERFNGDGYPLGLKGKDIPIEARIVAIADAYDAMTSDRPYRRKLSHEEAVEALTKGKESSFDPALVDIFISTFNGGKDGN